MSARTVSLSTPSSNASCVSSLQNSGSRTLSAALDGVVEILDNDLGEAGDVGPGEGRLTVEGVGEVALHANLKLGISTLCVNRLYNYTKIDI